MWSDGPDHPSGAESIQAPVAPRRDAVAGLLRERKEELLLRWAALVLEGPAPKEKRFELALRSELAALIDALELELEELGGSSPPSAERMVDGTGTWFAEGALSGQDDVDAALRGFSRFREVLLDLFFAEGVAPTRKECHLIARRIDVACAGVTTRMRDAERQRLTAIRDRVVAILGHDLRNPLNALTISSSLLQRRALPEGDAAAVNRIVSCAGRMAKMIEDLLEFAAVRLVPEHLPLARESCTLASVCEEAVAEMRLIHPRRTIALDVQNPGSGAWDRHRLLRVLSNLLGNAVAYGSSSADVRVNVAREGERMLVAVHNEGAPIEPTMVQTLFEPFERGVGVPGKPGGLGLGLFIARQIARTHEGDIRVESSAQAGTTFTLDLPIEAALP